MAAILKSQPLRPVAHLNVSVDGHVAPTAPAAAFAAGRQHAVPMIMGTTARDFTPGLPTWRAFREPERSYVELAGAGATVKQGLRRSQCDLYIENVNRAR